jgi:uncharacterized membrane protein
MTRSPSAHAAIAVFAAAIALLLLAATASASELKLECGGKGPRNADSAGTVLCASAPGKARALTGTVRNDSGQPVAAKVLVTFISWTPAGGGSFNLRPESTRTIVAGADGSFSVPVKTATRLNVKFETVADAALGISVTAAEGQVSLQIATKLKKLGGGRVRITAKGTDQPLKIYVLDSYGYELPGVKPKKAGKSGSATFNLGSRRGEFTYYVDAGPLADLFWEGARPTFKL